jgi:hypothetical protein
MYNVVRTLRVFFIYLKLYDIATVCIHPSMVPRDPHDTECKHIMYVVNGIGFGQMIVYARICHDHFRQTLILLDLLSGVIMAASLCRDVCSGVVG